MMQISDEMSPAVSKAGGTVTSQAHDALQSQKVRSDGEWPHDQSISKKESPLQLHEEAVCGTKDWEGGSREIEVHQQAALQGCQPHRKCSIVGVLQVQTFTENQQLSPRCPQKDSSQVCWTCSKQVSKLVFYAQSTSAVISGRYTFYRHILLFKSVYVLKLAYVQF